jgi:Ras-related protein Rab-11A
MLELKNNKTGDMVYMLVGNKTDLSHLREVSTEDGKNFAEKNDMYFIETSALNSTNVDSAFQKVVINVYNKTSKLTGGPSSITPLDVGQSTRVNNSNIDLTADHIEANKRKKCGCNI